MTGNTQVLLDGDRSTVTSKDHQIVMHLRSMLLSQVDGPSSDEDAQTLHSTGKNCQ